MIQQHAKRSSKDAAPAAQPEQARGGAGPGPVALREQVQKLNYAEGAGRLSPRSGAPSPVADRHAFGAVTYCDLALGHLSADLQAKHAAGEAMPLAQFGPGQALVEYSADYDALGPGMQLIVQEHEQVHVVNATPYCQSFRAALDQKASNWSFGLVGELEVSVNDYNGAHNDNHGGLFPDVAADEQMAYVKSVEVAERLLQDEAFAAEHEIIQLNLDQVFKPRAGGG